MRKSLSVLFFCLILSGAEAQVLRYADLTSPEIENLDRDKTALILPGGILEQHGPYLPAGTDGIFNSKLAEDLAAFVATRPGWKAVIFPSMPLGVGAANEIGRKYVFPGSVTVRPDTLRAVYMDWADQLGEQGFRWVLIVNGHGDPAHNRMLDDASDYFHDTYSGVMINIIGHVWAVNTQDLRTPEQQQQDGLPEHASMVETSVIMSLSPKQVSRHVRSAKAYPGFSAAELEKVASAPDWPGYFGAPALASRRLGNRIYARWLHLAKGIVDQALTGDTYRNLPRYGELFRDDPADATAVEVNRRREEKQTAWLNRRERGASNASQ